MSDKLIKYRIVIYLLLCISFGFILCNSLYKGHSWGGDFALYIRQSQSIIEQDSKKVEADMEFILENSSDKYFSPVNYPWGFPLLITPVIKLAKITAGPSVEDFALLKLIEIFFYTGFIALFFLWIKGKFKGIIPLAITVFIAMQSTYVEYLNHILAEMPYIMFMMASIIVIEYSIQYNRFERKRGYTIWKHTLINIAVGCLIFYTSQIRSEGFLLFPVLIAAHIKFLILHKKYDDFSATGEILKIFVPYVSALIMWVIWSNVFPSGYISHLEHSALISTQSILNNIGSYFRALYSYMPLPGAIMTVLFIITAVFGMFKNIIRDIIPATMLILSAGLFIVWPHYEWRYAFSLFPLLTFFFVRGLESLKTNKIPLSLPKYVIIIMAAIMFVKTGLWTIQTNAAGKNTMIGPNMYYSGEMFDFIKENTNPDDIVAFFRPRVMYLYTGRKSLTLTGDFEHTAKHAQWYVCTFDRGDFYQYSDKTLEGYKQYLKKAFQNNDFVIYKISRDEK